MPIKPREQIHLFKKFLFEFTAPISCVFCFSTEKVKSTLARIPGEDFDRYTNLCLTCQVKYKIIKEDK